MRRWLARNGPPLAVVAVGYLIATFLLLRAFEFNPTGPIRIGGLVPGDRFWILGTRVDRDGVGYDGQWFFYLAHDPLLRSDDLNTVLDLPAYRAARILYPALVCAAALGRPDAIPWAMIGVNLVAVLVGTLGTLELLRLARANRWLALGYAFSPPVLIGVLACLSEPMTYALVVWGVVLALRRRHLAAGLVLALAVLGREPAILVPAGFGLYAAARFDWRRALRYLAPLTVPVGWHLWIWHRFGSLPAAQSPTNFGAPFGGALYRLGLVLGWHLPMLGETAPTGNIAPEAAIILTSMAIVVVGLTKVLQRRDVFAWLLWMQAVLALFTGPLVWADLYSYARVLGLLYLCYGLALLTTPGRLSSPESARADWAIPVPDWTIFRTRGRSPITLALGRPLSTLKRHEHRT